MMDSKILEKKFEKRLKMRAALSAVIIVFGILSIVLSIYAESKGLIMTDGTMSGYYIGMGGGLIGAGVATFIRTMILLKDEEKQRKSRMKEYDERNLYLRSCTMTYSGYIMIGVIYVGIIIAGFYSAAVAMTLLGIMCMFLVVVFVVNVLLRKHF